MHRPVERPVGLPGVRDPEQVREARRLVTRRQGVRDAEWLRDGTGRCRDVPQAGGRERRPGRTAEPVDVVAALATGIGPATLVLDRTGLGGALRTVRRRGGQLDGTRVRRRGVRRHRGCRGDPAAQQGPVGVGRGLRGLRGPCELLGHRDRLGGVVRGRRGGRRLLRCGGRLRRRARLRRAPRGSSGADGVCGSSGADGVCGSNGSGSGWPVSAAARSASRRSRREGHSSAVRGAPKMSAALRSPVKRASEAGTGRASWPSTPLSGPPAWSVSRASSGRSSVTRTAPDQPTRWQRSTGTRRLRSSPWRRCHGRRRPPRRRRSRPRARAPRRP